MLVQECVAMPCSCIYNTKINYVLHSKQGKQVKQGYKVRCLVFVLRFTCKMLHNVTKMTVYVTVQCRSNARRRTAPQRPQAQRGGDTSMDASAVPAFNTSWPYTLRAQLLPINTRTIYYVALNVPVPYPKGANGTLLRLFVRPFFSHGGFSPETLQV